MSHFGLENDIVSITKMENSLSKVPLMRWERKMVDTAGGSRSDSNTLCSTGTSGKTPMKMLNIAPTNAADMKAKVALKKSPHRGKSPNKAITPTRGSNSGDRFIPNRSTTQVDLGHYLVSCKNSGEDNDEVFISPSKQQFQKAMNDNLNGELVNNKILGYSQKPPELQEGYKSGLKVLYSASKMPGSTSKPVRHIPQAPERILDAPEILDDYYLNLLDWSCQNTLAVCLGPSVYLWNASTGDIQMLMEMDNPDEYISSVAWVADGTHLAIGTSTSDVQLWDVQKQKKLRCMSGHAARVGCLSWNAYVLSSGSRSGYVHHHDVRVAEHLIGSAAAHSQEVCGLKWSPDGKYLASGGNDNLLNIYPSQVGQSYPSVEPLYTFNEHIAAVKALAWCPWQSSLLASGGGTADRHIRFWNCNTGSCLTSVDTNSQVCALLWSKDYHELISSHGFALNQLTIWSYPKLEKVTELTGHTSRVLHMAMSPDGSTVVSAAADETLRLWKCFASDPHKKAQQTTTASKSTSGSTVRLLNMR